MHPDHLFPRHAYLKTDIPVAGGRAPPAHAGSDGSGDLRGEHGLPRARGRQPYVVDTSIFPSIGAVNPALTAMANALRVVTTSLSGSGP
jgi:hypothetical protein